MAPRPRVLFVVNAEWYFVSHRLPLAEALHRRGYDVAVAAAEERGLGHRITEAGLRFIPIPVRRASMSIAADLRLLIALLRLYRRERPVLVHHVTIKPILYGALAAWMTGVPAVVNAVPGRGYVFGAQQGWRRWLRLPVLALYRFACRGARVRTIFQNEDDRDYFVGLGLAERSRTALIRGAGVNLRDFARSDEPDGVPQVVLASRLLWDKGVAEFVDAIRIVRSRGISCGAIIAGIPDDSNPNRVPVERLADWHKSGVIEWMGLCGDMPELLRRSAVVCLPSYYPEGVPKVLLEGAASGRPLVATDTPGCRDVVIDGVNGRLVPARNATALADALAELLQDAGLRRRYGHASRRLAEDHFGEDLVIGQTLAVYGELAPLPAEGAC
jgi:glycosyltransferase involved in cell wall biosynthesis